MLERTELALPHTPQAAHVGEGYKYCQSRTRFADDDDVALQILLLMM